MSNKLNKPEFLTILAEELAGQITTDIRAEKKVSKRAADEILTAVENAYARAIIEEDAEVALGGLGKFKPVDVPERTHRNPQTGKSLVKPAHKSVKFTVNKSFKNEVAEA